MRRRDIPPDGPTALPCSDDRRDVVRRPRRRRGDTARAARQIGVSVLLGLVVPLLVAVPILVAGWEQDHDAPGAPPEATVSARPNAPGSPGALIEAHDCWTGAAPTDVEIPGHVVAILPGRVTATYGGRRLTGLALEQIFNHRKHGLTVYAFCR